MSSEITFKITDGPYAGDYSIDPEDFTATELGQFRKAVGFPLETIGTAGVGLDVLAGMVWLVRRRSSRGLAFEAVADTIRTKNLELVTAEEVEVPQP